jgi:hypothetical protein
MRRFICDLCLMKHKVMLFFKRSSFVQRKIYSVCHSVNDNIGTTASHRIYTTVVTQLSAIIYVQYYQTNHLKYEFTKDKRVKLSLDFNYLWNKQ